MAKRVVNTFVGKILQLCGKHDSAVISPTSDGQRNENPEGLSLALDRLRLIGEERKGTSIVELVKEGHTLGLTVSGGIDKGCFPQISNLRPGSIAHRCDALAVGDFIISINGIRTNKLKHEEIVNLLKNAEEKVTLEVEYEIPITSTESSPCVCPKIIQIKLEKETGSFGFTLRGGAHLDRFKSRPLTITNVRFGGPADREGTIKAGDRLLAIDNFNLTTATLQDAMSILKQISREALFTIEYDVSILDAVRNALGPLLVEIDRTPGCNLGITLTRLPKPDNAIIIESIKQASIAERCGALHVGDHILAIDETKVDQMTPAEAMQLLKVSMKEVIKLEIVPARQMALQHVPDVSVRRGLAMPATFSPYTINSSAFNTLSSFGRQSISSFMPFNQPFHSTKKWTVNNHNRPLPLLSPQNLSNAPVFSSSMSGQVCHADTMQVSLCADYNGFGFSLQGATFTTEMLTSPPVIYNVDPGGVAEKSGVLQVGDRILAVNNKSINGMTADEVMHLIQQSLPRIILDVEFDVAESVVPSSGTFTVKLAKKGASLGITVASPKNRQSRGALIISDIRKGSVAHRIGTLQSGDKLLALNSINMDNCTIEDAAEILQNSDEIVKLRIQKDDAFSEDTNTTGNVVYTVELIRHGGPLGITISGSEEPFDPILISGLTEGGLAERTGALHVGDRLLAINGHSLCGKPLSEAILMLQDSGDSVMLKISRKCNPSMTSKNKNNQSLVNATKYITPIPSIDSAVESWDSYGLEITANDVQTHVPSEGDEQCELSYTPSKTYPKRSQPEKGKLQLMASKPSNMTPDHHDENWDLKTVSSQSYASSALSEDKADWSKVLEDLETCGQSQLLRQIEKTIMGSNPSLASNQHEDIYRNSLQYYMESQMSDNNQDINSNTITKENRDDKDAVCSTFSQNGRDNNTSTYQELYAVPVPIEVHRVTLFKDQIYEDFGFSVSDGLYERGVYVNRIRSGGPADLSGLLKPLDRILQVNNTKTQDFDCCLTVPLIASAGDSIELVISRPAYGTVQPTPEGSFSTDHHYQPWVDDGEIYSTPCIQFNNNSNQLLTKTL